MIGIYHIKKKGRHNVLYIKMGVLSIVVEEIMDTKRHIVNYL